MSHIVNITRSASLFLVFLQALGSKPSGLSEKSKIPLWAGLLLMHSAGKRIQISNHLQVFPEVEIATQFHFRPATKRKSLPDIIEKAFSASLAGSNLPCSNQITNRNPEELKEVQIQRFLSDLREISHFYKVFRVGQK